MLVLIRTKTVLFPGKSAAQRLGDRMLSHGHIEDNTHRGAGLVFAFTDIPKEF